MHTIPIQPTTTTPPPPAAAPAETVRRITSAALLQDGKAIEIEHQGKIYRLRVTQLNKLILTA